MVTSLMGKIKMNEVFFLNFTRLLVKDEVKKGSFEIKLSTGNSYSSVEDQSITLTDSDSTNNFRSNSPAGEYGF